MNAHQPMSVASALVALLVGLAAPAGAQAPAPPSSPPADSRPEAKPTAPAVADGPGPLAQLAWFGGCWRGSVNQREFREQWMPLRGNLLVGASHTVMEGKTQAYEYLRIEARDDGVYYVATPSDQKEAAFKLIDVKAEPDGTSYTFANPAHDFPQRIVYRRGTEGWLYATVEGKVGGRDRQVTYPMRRIDCETGEFIHN